MVVKRTPYVTTKYAAAVLGKTPKYILRLIGEHKLSARKQTHKANARWLITKESFDAFLTSAERGTNGQGT